MHRFVAKIASVLFWGWVRFGALAQGFRVSVWGLSGCARKRKLVYCWGWCGRAWAEPGVFILLGCFEELALHPLFVAGLLAFDQ